MLQPAFDIGNSAIAQTGRSRHLLVEISAQSLNYILYASDPAELLLLRQYRLYTTADKSLCDVISEVIQEDETIRQHAENALIVYNFPEAGMVPSLYHDEELNRSVARLVYGDDGNKIVFGEQVGNLNMHNVYRVPKEVHSLFNEKFRDGRYWHIYTMLLMFPDAAEHSREHIIRTVFYHDHFIAACFTGGQLQLIQTFHYQTPEDAAYYLLLICRQLNVAAKDMALTVSGLIDSQSALFAELLKYFSEVLEEGIPGGMRVNGLLEDFPAHYFSPLLKMPLCGL